MCIRDSIYPAASARSKEDEAFAAHAHEETFRLQHGERGERALWQHILRVSVEDLKLSLIHILLRGKSAPGRVRARRGRRGGAGGGGLYV